MGRFLRFLAKVLDWLERARTLWGILPPELARWTPWTVALSGLGATLLSLWSRVQDFPWPVQVVVGLAFFVVLLACGVLILIGLNEWTRWRQSRMRQPREPATASSQAVFGVAEQQSLRDTLKAYATEHVNVKILFASLKEKAMAETLISVFALAGWQTNLTNVPLESYRHEYFGETEVRGYNKHLVEAVTAALGAAGIVRVVAKVEPLGIKQENPKWPSLAQSIRITLGHQD